MSNNKRERLGSYNLNTRIACIYTLLFQWGRQHWRVVKLVTLSKEMEVLFSFLPFIPCIALSHLRPDCKCYPRLKRQKAYNWKKKPPKSKPNLLPTVKILLGGEEKGACSSQGDFYDKTAFGSCWLDTDFFLSEWQLNTNTMWSMLDVSWFIWLLTAGTNICH